MFIYLITSSVDILANIPKAIDCSRNVPVQNQLLPEQEPWGRTWLGIETKVKTMAFSPRIWPDLRTLNCSLCTSVSLREPGRAEPAEAIFNCMGQLWLMMTMDSRSAVGQISLSTALLTHSEQGCSNSLGYWPVLHTHRTSLRLQVSPDSQGWPQRIVSAV